MKLTAVQKRYGGKSGVKFAEEREARDQQHGVHGAGREHEQHDARSENVGKKKKQSSDKKKKTKRNDKRRRIVLLCVGARRARGRRRRRRGGHVYVCVTTVGGRRAAVTVCAVSLPSSQPPRVRILLSLSLLLCRYQNDKNKARASTSDVGRRPSASGVTCVRAPKRLDARKRRRGTLRRASYPADPKAGFPGRHSDTSAARPTRVAAYAVSTDGTARQSIKSPRDDRPRTVGVRRGAASGNGDEIDYRAALPVKSNSAADTGVCETPLPNSRHSFGPSDTIFNPPPSRPPPHDRPYDVLTTGFGPRGISSEP